MLPPNPGITPGRRTVVSIDERRYFTAETGLARQFDLLQIAPAGAKDSDRVEFVPSTGWRIASYQSRAEQKHEAAVADDSVLSPENGSAQVPDGILSVPLQRAYTELPGVTQGVNQRTSGDLFLRKHVASGESFDQVLTGDAAAYPSPPDDEGFQPLDRILVSTTPMEPNAGLVVVLTTPGDTGVDRIGNLARVYFGGIAGSVKGQPDGTGQYCLTLRGSGIAQLLEKDVDGDWQARRFFEWAQAGKVMGTTHTIVIRSDARKIDNKWRGSRLLFRFSNWAGVTYDGILNRAAQEVLGGSWQEYLVPQAREVEYQPTQVRLDVRRDVRAWIQTSIEKPYPLGTLNTVSVKLKAPSSGDIPLYVQWFGYKPDGCTVTVTLFDAAGNPIPSNGEIVNGDFAGGKGFLLPEGTTAVTARLTLTSSGLSTPTIRSVRFVRDHRIAVAALEPTELPNVTRLSLTDGGSDPTHETASFQCEDIYGKVPQLGYRSGMSVDVKLYNDPEDPEAFVRLFKGKVVSSPAKRPKGDDSSWRSYQIKAVGEWEKLQRAQLRHRIDLLSDPAFPDTPTPYKVTDLLKAIFKEFGYPPDMFDVPDLPIRFLGDDKVPTFLEPFTEAAPFAMKLIRDYLGGWLVFDASRGEDGQWRVKIPPQKVDGVYRYVCEFVLGPGMGDIKTQMNPAGYLPTTVGGFTVPRVPSRKGPHTDEVIAPEANEVKVFGIGLTDNSNGLMAVGGKATLSQIARNYKAAQFKDGQPTVPDPLSADYTDGEVRTLYYSDPGLTSQAAVDLVCRRLYDLVCHGRKRVWIEAPLVMVQESDDTPKRKPMYGDPCIYENLPYYIVECNIEASGPNGGDRFQLASYVIESIPELGDYRGIVNRFE